MRFIQLIIFCVCLFLSCKKKEVIDYAPKITFEKVNKSSIKEFSDTISIAIGYIDADGDIGTIINGEKNLFLIDSRDNTKLQYSISKIVNTSNATYIKGILNIEIGKVYLNNSNIQSENLVYTIYLQDRAGNKSNEVQTSNITITK